MKKYILLGIILSGVLLAVALRQQPDTSAAPSAAALCDISNSTWVKGPSIPANHMEAATAVVGGKFYVIAGFTDSSLNLTGRMDVYNPVSNQWETATKARKNAPVPFSHAQAAADSRYIWVAGGFIGKQPGQPTDRVWRYDTVNDSWTELPKLPQKRAAGLMVLENRTLHYIGGTSWDRDTSYDNHWTLNVDNTGEGWKSSKAMPNKRIHSSGAYLDGIIYAIGGQYKHDHDPEDLKLVHAFNVAGSSWSRKADLPFPRSHFEPATMIIGGQIVIVGGRANQNGYGNGQIVNVTAYNPQKDTWKELRQLPIKLIATNAAYIGNKMIVTGGGVNWNTITRDMYTSTVTLTNCSDSATEEASATQMSTATAQVTTEPQTNTPVTATPENSSPTSDAPATGNPVATTVASATPVPPTATLSSTGQSVVSLTLINAATDKDIRMLQNGDVIDLSQLGTTQISIRANTNPSKVGSVVFNLNGIQRYKVEGGAPYAIANNNGSDYSAWNYTLGQQHLTVIPYTSSGGSGTPGNALTLSFTIVSQADSSSSGNASPVPPSATSTPVPPTSTFTATPVPPSPTPVPPTEQAVDQQPTTVPSNTPLPTSTPVPPTAAPSQAVTKLVLVNALTDQDVMLLENGSYIDCAVIGTNKLTVRAETSPWNVGSVVFGLNSSPRYKVENGAPYALASNNGRDYFAWSLSNGNYFLTVTPYTHSNGSGTAGSAMQINMVLSRC